MVLGSDGDGGMLQSSFLMGACDWVMWGLCCLGRCSGVFVSNL